MFDCSIVIPAYNEERRLPRTLSTLATLVAEDALQPLRVREVLVVNDGSHDQTAVVAQRFAAQLPLRVLGGAQNYGKGHAVRTGLLAATQPWLLIADADMATPWEEAQKLALVCQKNIKIAIASRDVAGSELVVRQSWVREHLGKSFNRFVRLLTGLPFHDTQCGFKFMERTSVAPLLPALRENRFAWDVEFLLRAQSAGLGIEEIPVRWEHQEESRVHPVRDGLSMLWAVIKLRFHAK